MSTSKGRLNALFQFNDQLIKEEKKGLDCFLIRRIPHTLFLDFIKYVVKPANMQNVDKFEISNMFVDLMRKAVNEEKQSIKRAQTKGDAKDKNRKVAVRIPSSRIR